ncbi:hypothetical protein DFP72DRAFT_1049486 [Ephemerocybe angulata]|uniref:Uncharacterized protein n=1 Tax=Ephemerocybe angulata TaxID=980116 RepID=A0A8H6HMP1_9AGAR|nr:hypothetical protein DFP72DRAFT_1049486 [Tulosesus angulatus]
MAPMPRNQGRYRLYGTLTFQGVRLVNCGQLGTSCLPGVETLRQFDGKSWEKGRICVRNSPEYELIDDGSPYFRRNLTLIQMESSLSGRVSWIWDVGQEGPLRFGIGRLRSAYLNEQGLDYVALRLTWFTVLWHQAVATQGVPPNEVTEVHLRLRLGRFFLAGRNLSLDERGLSQQRLNQGESEVSTVREAQSKAREVNEPINLGSLEAQRGIKRTL